MRSVILISLTVLVVVVASGFGITWYIQAVNTRDAIEKAIADINTPQPYITYDSIQTSGFPQNVVVSIMNPRFKGRADQLFKKLFEAPGAQTPPPQLPEWNEDIALEGSLSVAVNALSDQYSAVVRGNWHQNSKIGTKTLAFDTTVVGDNSCVLQLGRGSSLFAHMWDTKSLWSWETIAKHFASLDCNMPGSSTVDKTNGAKLLSSGPARLYISNINLGNTLDSRLFVSVKDSEVTSQGDEIFLVYMNMLSPHNPSPPKFSVYGKQNIDVDISYKGPDNFDTIKATDANFSVNVSKFSIANNAYSSDLTAIVSNYLVGDARTSKLSFKSTNSFSEQYDALMQDIVRSYIAKLYAMDDPGMPYLQTARNKYTADQTFEIVRPAIPHFKSLGTATLALDLDASTNAAMNQGSATLNHLEMSATPYGITGSGSAKMEQPPFPTTQMALNCRNCLQLVDDVVDYIKRLEKMNSNLDPSQPSTLALDPRLGDGYKQFLTALGIPAAEKDTLQFQISSTPQAGPSVNGKDMMSVMGLYNQYVTPYLPKPQPVPQPAPTN